MGILDNAKSHFDKLETKAIEVPEWDSIIYATPFTMGEKKTLWKFAKDDDFEFMVRTLILKALDKDGNKLFDISNKVDLMNNASPDVITRIVGEISISQTIEDMEGN
jgi:hypothetical protein